MTFKAPAAYEDFESPNYGDLRLTSTNRKDGEPETVIVIEGFDGPEQINRFIDMLFEAGVFRLNKEGLN